MISQRMFRGLYVGLLMLGMHVTSAAAGPVVFVSAFAPGDKGGIHAFELDTKTGDLKALQRTGDAPNPFYLALAPNQKTLYAISAEKFGGKEPEQVAAYTIVGRSGELKLLNRQSSKGTASCYLQVDATGKTVLVSNYSSGSVASLPIKEDGSLGEPASFFEHKLDTPPADSAKPKVSHAHSIITSPNNRWVYAADLGFDRLFIYDLNAGTSQLTPHTPAYASTPAGSAPRHVWFHPRGKQLYVINEYGNSVTTFDYDDQTGALRQRDTISTVPSDFTGKSFCADLKITPDGRHLYGTNRGHDSIACYRIADDGQLSLIEIVPSLGKGPQNLCITPDGGWLLCANLPGKNFFLFQSYTSSCKLKASGTPVETPIPACIVLLP